MAERADLDGGGGRAEVIEARRLGAFDDVGEGRRELGDGDLGLCLSQRYESGTGRNEVGGYCVNVGV